MAKLRRLFRQMVISRRTLLRDKSPNVCQETLTLDKISDNDETLSSIESISRIGRSFLRHFYICSDNFTVLKFSRISRRNAKSFDDDASFNAFRDNAPEEAMEKEGRKEWWTRESSGTPRSSKREEIPHRSTMSCTEMSVKSLTGSRTRSLAAKWSFRVRQ